MDISVYIGELLYGHDCVIIPGFGGFICSYQSAIINAELNTISPPGKSVSFNRNLQSNDGLLANYISSKTGLTFLEATDHIHAWVNFSQALLTGNEQVLLNRIGRFFNDAEGNLQFEPDTNFNYLRSSFGLRTITVVPVVKEKELKIERRVRRRDRILKARVWRMAATIAIIVSIATLAEMMWLDIPIKSLKLDEANVISFVNRLFKTDEHILKPIPVEVENNTITTPVDTTLLTTTPEPVNAPPVTNEIPVSQQPVPVIASPQLSNNGLPSYYIIIGAFKEEQNAGNAKNKLLQKYPEENILYEKHGVLTKVGYYAGNNVTMAKELLTVAHTEDAGYWLLKK